MYRLALLFHSYTRWLVLIAMVWALFYAWRGWLGNRPWTRVDRRAGLLFTVITSMQFVLGLLLYVYPSGLARTALRNLGAAMEIRELRFFGIEHPLQMVIAIGLVHLGSARSRKARAPLAQHRWAVLCYTLAALAILTAIPWWRPLLRIP